MTVSQICPVHLIAGGSCGCVLSASGSCGCVLSASGVNSCVMVVAMDVYWYAEGTDQV